MCRFSRVIKLCLARSQVVAIRNNYHKDDDIVAHPTSQDQGRTGIVCRASAAVRNKLRPRAVARLKCASARLGRGGARDERASARFGRGDARGVRRGGASEEQDVC